MLAPVLSDHDRSLATPLAVESKVEVVDHQTAIRIGNVVLRVHKYKACELSLLVNKELLEGFHLGFVEKVETNHPFMKGSGRIAIPLLGAVHKVDEPIGVPNCRLSRILHHGAGL